MKHPIVTLKNIILHSNIKDTSLIFIIMLRSFKTRFHIQPNQRPYHIVSIHSPWRKMPPILQKIREEEIDIRRAYITKNTTVLYLKDITGFYLPFQKQFRLTNLLSDYIMETPFNSNIRLSSDTEVLIYNIHAYPYTILEFTCTDRTGLLSDLIELLSILPIDIQMGHIHTVDKYAHNILYLHKNHKPLSEIEIQYIQNIFEYEVKAIGNNESSL